MKAKGKIYSSRQLKSAFTLAEVLIVIGIIGVVAALTLPNLNHAIGDKEQVTKYLKLYSSLVDAYDRATVVYGPIDEWFKYDRTPGEKAKRFGERITEFMKISKICGYNQGCFSSSKLLNVHGSADAGGDVFSYAPNDVYCYNLTDGAALAFLGYSHGDSKLAIDVDIDGPNKGKNQKGFDRFIFDINQKNELVPFVNSSDDRTGKFRGFYDTGWWVLTNRNLDYLKCINELNWETKTSCK